MLFRILLPCLLVSISPVQALEVSNLSQIETIKFVLDWQQQHPDKQLDSITRRSSRPSGYSRFTICYYPVPMPIRATFNTKHSSDLSTYGVIDIEAIDFSYTNELLVSNCIGEARVERETKQFGHYVNGCRLSENINNDDLTAVKRLFDRSEIVTLHRTQTPLSNLQYFAENIEKIEDGLCVINLAGIFQEYKVSLRYKTADHTYRIGKRNGFYIQEAPAMQLHKTSLEDLVAIVQNGRFSQKEGALRYITDRFIQANPKAQTTNNVFAAFGSNAQQMPQPIEHQTSITDLETLLPLIAELIPSTQTRPKRTPPLGVIGMQADEALSAAQALKAKQPFSRNKFRRHWKSEDMQKRAEEWNGEPPEPSKPEKEDQFDFEF